MNNYEDYLKQVADLGGANSKKPLQDFYNINGALIRFFGMINTQMEFWLQNKNLDDYTIDQILNSLNQQKPILASLKFEASQTDMADFEGNTRTKLEKQLAYIKNEMVLEEAELVLQNLKQLKTAPKAAPKPETPKNDSNFLRTFLKTEYGEGYTYEGDLLNNLPHGNGALYYPNKQIYAIGTWANGRLQNQAKVYYDNGKLWLEGSFLNGRLNNIGKEYYYYHNTENLSIIACFDGNYNMGQLLGNGQINCIPNLTLEGHFKENGKIENVKINFQQIDMVFTTEHWFEGTIISVNKALGLLIGDGKAIRIMHDSYNNKTIKYTDIGKFNISFSKNYPELFGIGKVLNDTKIWQEGFYENNELVKGKSYHTDGSLWFDGEFQLSKEGYSKPKTGKRYSDGKVWAEGEFKDYELNGKGIKYFSDGCIQEIGWFVDGKLEGKNCMSYDFSTEWFYEYNLPKNVQHLESKISEFSGEEIYYVHVLHEEGSFIQGKLHGIGKRYDYKGELIEQGTFINGVFQGK